jgi:hypothetical protein
MTAPKYTFRWCLAVGALHLFIFTFPYMLPPLVRATGCQGIGGACGAVALVFGIYLRLPVVIGVGIYLAFLVWKRSRQVGFHPWAFIFLVIIYLAALPFLFSFGNFWAASFALGIGYAGGPLPVLAMLLTILCALSCLPDGSGAWPNAAHQSSLVTGGLALFVTTDQWLQGLLIVPLVGSLLRPVLFPIKMTSAMILRSVGNIGLLAVALAFIVSIAWWVISARRIDVASQD